MSIGTFILAWMFAVGTMTVFSAIWSKLVHKQFREPTLLTKILIKEPVNISKKDHPKVLGWTIHIFLGLCFLALYEGFWYVLNVNRTFLWALILGVFMGILGILGWSFLFKMVSFYKEFDYKDFYIHIFFAHIVFTLSAFWVNMTG
ncbi:MAG: hypothetical protein WA749_10000 [Gelidibacter sp.]